MPAQPPNQEKFSFKEQVNTVRWLMHFGSLQMMVILHRDVGFRTLNLIHLIGTALAMVVIAGFVQNPDDRPTDLMLFAVVMLAFAFWQKFKRWREIGNGVMQNSHYIGTSWFKFRWLPGYMRRNRRVERFLDPVICFAIGLVVIQFSPALGLWLLVSSLCLRFAEYEVWRQWLYRSLDTLDGTIIAERQSAVVDRFMEPTTAAPASRSGDDLPTGPGDDIEARIRQRKSWRKPVVSTPAASPAQPPRIASRKIILVGAVAVTADVLQCFLNVQHYTGLTFILEQALNLGIDAAAMTVLIRLLGFHWLLVPCLIVEVIPGLDVVPAWTVCAAYLVWRNKKPQPALPKHHPPPEIINARIVEEPPSAQTLGDDIEEKIRRKKAGRVPPQL